MGWRWGESRRKWGARWRLWTHPPCLVLLLLGLSTSGAAAAEWTAHTLGGEAAAAPIYGISCPTESLCVGVGGNNTIVSSTDPTGGPWNAIDADEGVVPGSPNQREIKGVSCPSTTLCVAVSLLGKVLTASEPTGGASAWSIADLSPGGPNIHLYGVACTSTTFCVAVGGEGTIATSTDPAGGAAAWSVTHLPVPLQLRGVSCDSPTFCVAVGDTGADSRPLPTNSGEVVSSTAPLAGLWAQVEPPGSHASLYGVSCPSTSLCVSGDLFGNVVGTASPTGPASGWASFPVGGTVQITGADCVSTTQCLLVDNNGNALTSAAPLAGSGAWTLQNLVPYSYEPFIPNALWSASCASAEFCAIGGTGEVLTSTDPAAPPAPAPTAKGGAGSGAKKQPAKHKARPKRPKVILIGTFDAVVPHGKGLLQYRFHVKPKFQVRGFVCSFDHRKMHRCRSPQRFRVGLGRHHFRVAAIGWTGLRGPIERTANEVCRYSVTPTRCLKHLPKPPGAVPAADASARPAPFATPPAPRPSDGVAALGLGLLGKLPPGNAVISPDSIATALAMVGTGATGPTADQIASTLGLNTGVPGVFDDVGRLQRAIDSAQARAGTGHPGAPTLTIANGLFVQSGFALKPEFVGGLGEHFGAAPESVDFGGDSPGAVAAINSWTSAHTNGVIPELFSELSPETRLVLANAVYLKAKWRHEFEKSDTYPAPFHRTGGDVTAEFMHQENRFLYGSGPGYQAVDLPYRGSKLSITVVLPTGGGSVGALEGRLRKGGLGPITHKLSLATVNLTLPRFQLHTEASLNPALEALGMKLPFSEAADFSGITSAAPLRIGEVRHVADIKVNEEGTEAAAATGVTVTVKSATAWPRPIVTFKADHPFLFFVRDDKTGAVLFAGRLTDPQGT
jgi:serpin B